MAKERYIGAVTYATPYDLTDTFNIQLSKNGEINYIHEEVRQERLSDEEIGILVSNVGNLEAKALTLIAMEKDKPYTMTGLQRRLIELQGDKVGWEISAGTPQSYCKDSFAPAGLVSVTTAKEGSKWQFTKTGPNLEVAEAFIGLMIPFSERRSLTLGETFGSSSSIAKPRLIKGVMGEQEYKSRTPAVRLQIYWQLVTSQEPMSWRYLAEQIGGDNSGQLSNHLIELARDGIITFNSRGVDKPYKQYQISENAPLIEPSATPATRGSLPKLTEDIHNITKSLSGWFTTQDVITKYFERYPDKQQKPSIPKEVYRVLRHLEKNDYLKAGGLSKETATEISLTSEQRTVLVELLTLVDGIQRLDPKFIEAGIRESQAIVADPNRFSSLMAKSKEKSHFASNISLEETLKDLYHAIQENPGISTKQVTEMLEKVYGTKLKYKTVATYLEKLKKENKLKVGKKGHANYWEAVEESNLDESERLSKAREELRIFIEELPKLPPRKSAKKWKESWDKDYITYGDQSISHLLPKDLNRETVGISGALSVLKRHGVFTITELNEFPMDQVQKLKHIGGIRTRFVYVLKKLAAAKLGTDEEVFMAETFDKPHAKKKKLSRKQRITSDQNDTTESSKEKAKHEKTPRVKFDPDLLEVYKLPQLSPEVEEFLGGLKNLPEGKISGNWIPRWENDFMEYKGQALSNLLPRDIYKKTTNISVVLTSLKDHGIISRLDLHEKDFDEEYFLSMYKIGEQNIALVRVLKQVVDAEFGTTDSQDLEDNPDEFAKLGFKFTQLYVSQLLSGVGPDGALSIREITDVLNTDYDMEYETKHIPGILKRLGNKLESAGYLLQRIKDPHRKRGYRYYIEKADETNELNKIS